MDFQDQQALFANANNMLITHNLDPQQVNGGTNTFGGDGLGAFTPSGADREDGGHLGRVAAHLTHQQRDRPQDISPLTAYTQDKQSRDRQESKANHFTTGRGSNDDLARELGDTTELPKAHDLKGWANKKDSTHTHDEFLMRNKQILSRER